MRTWFTKWQATILARIASLKKPTKSLSTKTRIHLIVMITLVAAPLSHPFLRIICIHSLNNDSHKIHLKKLVILLSSTVTPRPYSCDTTLCIIKLTMAPFLISIITLYDTSEATISWIHILHSFLPSYQYFSSSSPSFTWSMYTITHTHTSNFFFICK